MKWTQILVGVFIGFLLTYNFMLYNVNYRISFYGYKQMGEQIIPIIKLRKTDGNLLQKFTPKDWGIELELGDIEVNHQSITFTDKQMDNRIKQRYCK